MKPILSARNKKCLGSFNREEETARGSLREWLSIYYVHTDPAILSAFNYVTNTSLLLLLLDEKSSWDHFSWNYCVGWGGFCCFSYVKCSLLFFFFFFPLSWAILTTLLRDIGYNFVSLSPPPPWPYHCPFFWGLNSQPYTSDANDSMHTGKFRLTSDLSEISATPFMRDFDNNSIFYSSQREIKVVVPPHALKHNKQFK